MKKISFACILTIICCLVFLGYRHILQPYAFKRNMDSYQEFYYSSDEPDSVPSEHYTVIDNSHQFPNQNKFTALLEQNSDVCGWITIPGTNIDYPVVSATSNTTEHYLTHNFDGEPDRNGTLFLDYRTALYPNTKSLVINGHNMISTGLMFHELEKYKKMDFYQENPTFIFDTLYGDGQWKIFSVFLTNNKEKHGQRFNYFRNNFSSDEEFLDFIYQLQLRSLYDCPVMLNEQDQLLLLSTCTDEMSDMRLVIAARKTRSTEESTVETSLASIKKGVLYPDAWYDLYGGTRPSVTSFTESYSVGEITWYDGYFFD